MRARDRAACTTTTKLAQPSPPTVPGKQRTNKSVRECHLGAHLARLEGSQQVRLIHHAPSPCVHQEHALLALGEGGGVDEVLGVLAAGGVQGDDVALGQQRVQVHLVGGWMGDGVKV